MGSWRDLSVVLGYYILFHTEFYNASADGNVCKRFIEGCLLDDCKVEIPCVHGACDAQGFCACEPCWEGESCDEYVDVYPPSFQARSEVIGISDPYIPRPVYQARAVDRDLEMTCSGRVPCECAEVRYDIVAGNPYEIFSVDDITGNVVIKDPDHLTERASFPVILGAWSKASLENNTEPDSTVRVIFYLDSADEFHGSGYVLDHNDVAPGHHHTRRKRDTPIPQQSESLNYRTDFNLNIVGGDPAAMELGRVLEYELVISVPPTDRMDLLVDIFTKDVIADNYVPPLAIYNLKTEIPPEMSFSNGEPAISKMLSDSVTNVYDRMVIEFGTLSNPDTTRKIVIRFAVTAVRVKLNSKIHYVTVGAEYDYETFVWVGQTEVTISNPKPTEDEKKLEVDVIGPGEVALDSAGVFSVGMFLKIRSDKVSVVLEGPQEMEDLLAIGNLGITSFGENYQAVPNDVSHYKTVMTPSATKESYSSAMIDMGLITNTGSIYQKARVESNRINFTFAVFALNRADHVDETHSFTLKINVANKNMYTETFYVNLTAPSFDEPLNNVEDAYPVTDLSKVTLSMLVKYTVNLNVTPGGFTGVRVMLEMDPDNPIQLCSARFSMEDSGFNIPWVNTSSASAVVKDNHYIVDLGRVYVSDQRQPASGNDNMLVVETFLYLDNEVEISFKEDGNLFPIKMKIGRGDDARMVPFEPVSVEPKRFMYNPDVKIFDAAGWREIYIGGAVAYDIVITMPPGATHNNVTVDVFGLNNPALPGVHVCRARVSFVGRGLPCLQAIRDNVNTIGTTYGKVNPLRKDTDTARVNLGLVSHIPKSLGNITESKIIVNVVANLQDDVEFANGAPLGIISTLAINSKTIHTEEKKFVASRGPSKDLLKNNPIYAYSIPLWTEPVAPGFVTQFEIAMKTPPRTMGLYVIEVTTANPDISICVLKIKSVGDSLPCLDATTAADYVLHDDINDGNRKASLALQALANVGTYPMSPNKYIDPNTVVFSVIIKIKETATKNKALKFRISYGSKGTFEESLTVPIAAPSKENGEDTGLAKPPRMMKVGTHEENITTTTPGAMVLMTMFMELQPFSAAPISFDLKLDDGVAGMNDFELCQEGISHLGKNYPCTKPSQWIKEPPRPGSRSYGYYNLNLMCNSFIDRKNPDENMLLFTVPLLLKHNAGIGEGTEISFTSTVVAGEIARKTQTVKFKVADVPDQTLGIASPKVKSGAFGDVDIRIRQKLWVPFNITLARGTMAELRVEFRGAVHEKSAIVNLHDVRILAVGRNIPCWKSRPLNISFTSSFGNVQMDKATTSLGFFSNPGYSHVRNQFIMGDDDVVVEVLAEMTDHSVAEDATRHPVTLTVSSLDWKAKATQFLKVTRTGKERTFIDLSVVTDDSRIYEREERVQVTAYLRHSPDSSAEPSKFTFRMFLPYFITFEALADVISVSQYKPTVKNSTMGVDIVFPTLMFADEVELNFTLAVDPENKRGYGTGRMAATIPYRALCDQHSRAGQKQTGGLACSDMKHVLFTVNSNECVFDLGMESGAIENCQITASSAADYEHAPFYVRKGGTKVWSPALKSSLSRHHLDVNFQRVTRVSQIEVLYVPGSRRVSRYSLMYSNNGRDWIKHGEVRALNYKNSVATDRLEKTIQARMLRIIIEEASDEHTEEEMLIGMQVELYGCYIEELKVEGVVCEEDTTWYSDSKSKTTRHFAVDTAKNIVYFCDFHGMSKNVACFSSNDEGKTWRILDSYLNYLVGFDPESGKMLATDSSGESYMCSDDGTRWSLVPPRVANASSLKPGFLPSIPVPAVTRSDILSKNLIIGDWRATYDGLVYKDAESPSAVWSGCCPM